MAMSGPLRVGILSFAHYHANFWATAINDHPDAILAGIWDDDRARGQAAAEQHGAPFVASLADLLARCDAIGITSETARHADLVEEAARQGVHILLEKPIATSLPDCERIERAVAESGVLFMQNFPKRFDPINHELREMVRRGDLGEIGLVRVRHGHHHGLDPAFGRQWYANPAMSGGGTLIDEGVHAADFLHWVFGRPVAVHATISGAVLGWEVDDTAAATFTFASGMIAEVATSWAFVAADQSIDIYGTKGTALLGGVDLASRDLATVPRLRVFSRDSDREGWAGSTTVPGFIAGGFHAQGPRRFIDGVLAGSIAGPGLEAGRVSLEMVLAAYRSAASGQREPVGEVEGDAGGI